MSAFPERPLKFVADIEMGLSPPSSAYRSVDQELPFLQGNAEFGSLHPSAKHGCDAAAKRCRAEDLLISVRAPVGAANIADRVYGIGRGLCAVTPAAELDRRFLWYLAIGLISQRLHRVARGSTYDAVSAEDLGRMVVPVPALGEQRRIADRLDRETAKIDNTIARKRRLLDRLDEKRTAVTFTAVSGALGDPGRDRTPSDVPWLDTLPNTWRVAKLSLVAKLGTGHTPSRLEPKYWEGERDIAWLTTGDIEKFRDDRLQVLTETRESISRLGLENSAAVLHPEGTVALSRTASVGFSVIMGRDMATSQDFVTWTCSDLLESRFLLLCLRAMRPDLVGRLAMGSTHQTIYFPDIQGLRIPLPPLNEQREAIAAAQEEFRAIDAVAALVERQLPLLEERHTSLITAAVTGQLGRGLARSPVPA